jgi:Flp pilus assembly protein TadB
VGNGYSDSGDQLSAEVEDTSLGEIVGRLASDFSRLMRAEIALAKAEAKEEAKEAGKGVGLLAGAGYAGHLLVLFLSLAVMFGLGHWMPLGWAALIVAVIWGIVAFVLQSSGRKNLKRATPPMPETVETLKEDAQWAKRPRG